MKLYANHFHEMSSIHLIVVIISVISSVSALTDVQISTCNVPIRNEPTSLCCFTSNLPVGASVYFSKNTNHVIRISQSCEQIWVPENSIDAFYSTCSSTGSMSNFSIASSRIYSDIDEGDVWECGFYGNKSKLVIMDGQILDENRYIRQTPGKNISLSFSRSTALLTSFVRLYKLEDPSHTLLEVDKDNNDSVYVSWLRYTGDIGQNVFSVELIDVRYNYNGSYVFEIHFSAADVTRNGFTLIVNKNPSMPTINSSSDWELTENKASGSVACVSYSQSAAPLYYTPTIETEWRLPVHSDLTPSVSQYSVVIYNNTAFISGVDCTKPTLPIYCTAIDGPLVSHSSQGFDPRSMCTVLGFNIPFEGDPTYRALVKAVCIFVTTTVFTCVITVVVARHFLKKKLKRCGRKCRTCCTCSAVQMPRSSSDSDSDSDNNYRATVRRSRHESRSRSEGRHSLLDLADGLRSTSRDITLQRALEHIAIEESRLYQVGGNSDGQVEETNNEGLRGAEGGARHSNDRFDADRQLLNEAENLLDQHNRHLRRDTVQLKVHRNDIVDNLLNYYADETVAMSRVNVEMIDEEGIDYGGVAYDMYTTFWNRVQEEQFFLGSDRVVPHLLPHKIAEESKYRIFGRILSHSVAVLKSFPLPMCKSTVIAMVFETTEVSQQVLTEDFLFFLDEVDRKLVTDAINGFPSLTVEQKAELGTIFERYDYAVVLSEGNFLLHLTQLARHTLCLKPKPLLDKMRSGIPPSQLEHFWSCLHQDALNVLYQALKPTAERIVARLKPDDPELSRRQATVLDHLKTFLNEMSQVELETFLVFVTGKKSMPRQQITIAFTTERGNLRTPRAHTCSSLMELPETYESYDAFRSEFKHLLASDEAQRMTMA